MIAATVAPFAESGVPARADGCEAPGESPFEPERNPSEVCCRPVAAADSP